MYNDDKEDKAKEVSKRRPFLFEVPQERVDDILKAYRRSDEVFFRRKVEKRKKVF